VSATDQTIEPAAEEVAAPESGLEQEPILTIELGLTEAEALHAWLLKPAQDGTTSLEDPSVSRALAKLGMAVDAVVATANVRRELRDSGLVVDHLSDEQVRDLGRRVAQAATPSIRR
jgi:hypothetical protein